MGKILGVFYASLVLCLFSSSGALGHDLEDPDDDSEGPAYGSSGPFRPPVIVHFTPAPTPPNAQRVESIQPLNYEREKASAEVLAEADGYIKKLEAEEFYTREEGSKKLLELGKANSGLYDYLNEKLESPQPPETRWRLGLARNLLSPRASWEQVRWKLYTSMIESDQMKSLNEGLDGVLAKLTKEEKKSLTDRIPPEAEDMTAKSKINVTLSMSYNEREKQLDQLLQDEIKMFTRAAIEAGYEVIPGKAQYYTPTKTLMLSKENSTWMIEFNRSYNVRVAYSAMLPMESVPFQASKLFAPDLMLPNNQPAHAIGEAQLYGRILFTNDGARQFVVHLSPTSVTPIDDPLFAPTQILKAKFPADIAAIEKVHLSDAARAKALVVPSK